MADGKFDAQAAALAAIKAMTPYAFPEEEWGPTNLEYPALVTALAAQFEAAFTAGAEWARGVIELHYENADLWDESHCQHAAEEITTLLKERNGS